MARVLAIVLAFSILAVFALIMGCSTSEEILLIPQREAGTMRGYVISVVADTPVPHAKVHIISIPFSGGTTEETVSIVTYTDENGWYDYNVPHGRVVVVISKSGYKRPDPRMWSLSPSGNGRLDFQLVPGTSSGGIDQRIHDTYCLQCHYKIPIADPNTDGRSAYPPGGTGNGGNDKP